MKTTTTTSHTLKIGRAMLLCVLIAQAITPAVHAGSIWETLKQSAGQGERNPHAPASVAAVRG